jgi:hypothetical protein
MGAQPDEVRELPGGQREEIYYRSRRGPRNERSRKRKLIGPDGNTLQVWHEVVDADGNIIHQHLMS